MKQRLAAKVLETALEGHPYRASTIERAATRIGRRRTIKSRQRLRKVDAAAMTVAFMRQLGSIHDVRFWLDSKQAHDQIEAIG
jgi:hypothetical protein